MASLRLVRCCTPRSPDLANPLIAALIRMMDLTVLPDGRIFPARPRHVSRSGKQVYEAKCLACHGVSGQGQPDGPARRRVGLTAYAPPVKTVNSYWPFATSLFDYIRRAMPLTTPQTLRPDEVYSLVAYILHRRRREEPMRCSTRRAFRGEDAESRWLPELVGKPATLSGAVANASQPAKFEFGLRRTHRKGVART